MATEKLTVNDVMTADPVTLSPSSPVSEAAKLMRDNEIGDVIVTDGETVVGIVTDRDLVVRGLADECDPQTPVRDVYSRDIATVSPEDDAHAAARLMRDKSIRRLPVVDEGRPVGIVSIGDLAQRLDPDSALAEISHAQSNN